MMRAIKFVVIILVLFTSNIFSQPYYFYSDLYSEEEFYHRALWRVNLQTGEKEMFYHDAIKYEDGDYRGIKEIDWDPEQQWVYCWMFKGPKQMRRPWDGTPMDWILLDVFKADNPSVWHEFPDTGSCVNESSPDYRKKRVHDGIIFNKHRNEFYVIWSVYFDSVFWSKDYLRVGIYDASTFALKDTFHIDESWLASTASVSADGSKLYVERWEHHDEKEIGIFSIDERKIIKRKSIAEIGFPAKYKTLRDNKAGKYLLSCHYPGDSLKDRKVYTYDIEKDSVGSVFSFPYNSDNYFSGDGRYIILEEIEYTHPGQYTWVRVGLGKIWIYESATGKFVKKLNLPQDGKILVFDSYPNMLYYYLPKEGRSINIDLSKPAPLLVSLEPSVIYAGGGDFTLTVKGKNFTNGSTILWNGNPKPTIYISDSVLQGNISARDIVKIDTAIVTVRAVDGVIESNSMQLYVLKKITVRELLDSLQIQLQKCYEKKFLGDRTFYKELDTHVREARRFYERRDTIRCAQEIEKFYTMIRREYNLKRKDHRYITEEGYGILYPLAREIEKEIETEEADYRALQEEMKEEK